MNLQKMIAKIEWALDFFLLSLPVALTFSRALVEILLVLIITAWISLHLLERRKIQLNSFLTWPLLAFWLSGLLSIASSEFLMKSLAELLNLTEYLLLAWISFEQFQNSKRSHLLIPVLTWSSFAMALDGLVQLFLGHDIIRWHPAAVFQNTVRLKASFSHPNNFSAYLAMVIPLSLLKCYEKKSWLYFLMLPILLWAMVLTYSRGAWVGLGAALTVFGIIKDKKMVLLLIVLLFVALLTFPEVMTQRIKDIFDFKNITTQMRFESWKEGWSLFLQKPILGHGLKTFSTLLNEGYAHNCYLQILAETGILGLLSFLWLLSTAFIRFFKARQSLTSLGFLCSLTAFSIHAASDTHLYSIPIATFFWLLLGAGLGLNLKESAAQASGEML